MQENLSAVQAETPLWEFSGYSTLPNILTDGACCPIFKNPTTTSAFLASGFGPLALLLTPVYFSQFKRCEEASDCG